MADIVSRMENLDKRIGALEGDGVEDSAALTQISKLYADLEIEVVMRYWLHAYRRAGDTQALYGAVCGTDTYL